MEMAHIVCRAVAFRLIPRRYTTCTVPRYGEWETSLCVGLFLLMGFTEGCITGFEGSSGFNDWMF